MKAIQVKYMPVTNTKPARLKVWAMDIKPQYVTDTDSPYQAAKEYADTLGWLAYDNWNECARILTEGTIPNGDKVFVITDLRGEV